MGSSMQGCSFGTHLRCVVAGRRSARDLMSTLPGWRVVLRSFAMRRITHVPLQLERRTRSSSDQDGDMETECDHVPI